MSFLLQKSRLQLKKIQSPSHYHFSDHSVINKKNTLKRITANMGILIVDNEQKGASRAQYTQNVSGQLSVKLINEVGTGFSVRKSRLIRIFYLTYSGRKIRQ
jgi:hypothetical protein